MVGPTSIFFRTSTPQSAALCTFAFDILFHKNRNLTALPLSERRITWWAVIESSEHVALSQVSDRPAAEMLKFAKDHGLEGVVAKRSDSVYQPGQRTGLWSKYRINLGQEFVVELPGVAFFSLASIQKDSRVKEFDGVLPTALFRRVFIDHVDSLCRP